MAPRRWLWPCSDSHVLRLPAYQKPSLQACLVHPENPDQILVDESDDDLDDHFHAAKRRRIESIAHAFLNGQPIYIPSARLKGPFPADRDLSLCHDLSSPHDQPVSPPPVVTADTFIRRRPEHIRHKSVTPDTANTPSKPRQSSPVSTERPTSRPQTYQHVRHSNGTKSLRFNLPSSAVSHPNTVLPPLPKFVAINKVSQQALDSADQPPSSTAPTHSRPSHRVPVPDTDFVSPSPSPSKDNISPSKAAVLRPASLLNKISKTPSSTHKLPSVKKNWRPTKRVYQAATSLDTTSPFIYRKNAVQSKKISEPTKSKSLEPEHVVVEPSIEPTVIRGHAQNPVSPGKRHHVLFESSSVGPGPKPSHELPTAVEPVRSPDRPRHDVVPAINMSFGQESLGMDFNLLNGSLPASSKKNKDMDVDVENQNLRDTVVASNLHAENNQSDINEAQSPQIEPTEAPADKSGEREISLTVSSTEDETVCGPRTRPSVSGDLIDQPMQDNIMADVLDPEDDVAEELPYISTQAAIQDAHRALFDASSPLQPQEDKFELPFETPAKQITSPPSSPIHTITPFHQFNAELMTDTQAPLPNTQALFDGFYSPIKLSARKSKTTKRASFAPSVILEDEDDTVTSNLDFPDEHIVREDNGSEMDLEQDEASTANNHGAPLAQGLPSPTGLRDQSNPSSPRNLTRSPLQQSPANRSESPDFILSQKTAPSTRESVGHALPALRQESVSLSEVLNFVSQRRGIDVDTLLSQATPPSSSRSLNKTNRASTRSSGNRPRSSGTRPRSSMSKSLSSQSRRSLPEKKVGQRRSTRLSLSQPNPQLDGADDGSDTEVDSDGPSATQPNPIFTGSGRFFALASFDVPDGSSTIPDPSLAFNHAQQNATPASEKLALTPGSAPQSTGQMSNYQHAQKQYSSLTDLDSTMPDLPQTFLPPVR